MTAPARRNPLLWLVIGLPVATVLAGVWTFGLVVGSSGIDTDPDPVRRTAQVQVVALDADTTAAERGLQARLAIAADGSAGLTLPAGSGPRPPVLQFVHPIQAGLDRQVMLVPDPHGWRVPAGFDVAHGWQLRLVGGDGSWRLVGRWRPGEPAVDLQPAVAVP